MNATTSGWTSVETSVELPIDVETSHVGFLCSECRERESFATAQPLTHDGTIYCESCFGDRFTLCQHCSEFAPDAECTTVDGESWCETCTSEDASECEHCHDTCSSEDTTTVSGEDWCTQCTRDDASRCDSCSEYVPDEDTYPGPGHWTLCEACYQNDYFTCQGCDDVYDNDDYAVDGYCDDCWKERSKTRVLRLFDRWDDGSIRQIRVFRTDSLEGGNCTPGTDQFIDDYFPHLYKWASVTIGEIIDRTCPDGPDALIESDMDFAKQVGAACLHALRRHRHDV